MRPTEFLQTLPFSQLEIGLIVLLIATIVLVLFKLFRRRQTRKSRFNATGWTLLVDGSNFAHRTTNNGSTKVRLHHLMEVLNLLEHHFKNADIKVFCDANLRYKLNKTDQRKFIAEVEQRKPRFHETHGKSADDVLLQYARKHKKCIIVSNDHFSKDDEPNLRLGTPLLKLNISPHGPRLPRTFDLFRPPAQPFKHSPTPLHKLF